MTRTELPGTWTGAYEAEEAVSVDGMSAVGDTEQVGTSVSQAVSLAAESVLREGVVTVLMIHSTDILTTEDGGVLAVVVEIPGTYVMSIQSSVEANYYRVGANSGVYKYGG